MLVNCEFRSSTPEVSVQKCRGSLALKPGVVSWLKLRPLGVIAAASVLQHGVIRSDMRGNIGRKWPYTREQPDPLVCHDLAQGEVAVALFGDHFS